MAAATVDHLTDALIDACLACDATRIAAAIKKGANINRPNHLGLFPVHIVVDPGNHDTDRAQASCLALLLRHGVELEHKHRNVYTVCERISHYLPQCGLTVIAHLQDLPATYDELEKDEQSWWDHLFGQWKSSKDASSLELNTALAQGKSDRSRL